MALTVRRFLDAGRGDLHLTVESGDKHLDREVLEEVLNRPGLALAGFLKYFAHRRIQVLGLAEMNYLKGLPAEECAARLHSFFDADIPCLVLSRNLRPLPGMLELAEEHRVPVLRSSLITGHFVRSAAAIIEEITAPVTRYQGTMVDIQGIGVMLEGAPGVGKSETALSLVARRGCSLVADDLVELRRTRSGELIGRAADVTRYHMEIRGLGIIHVPSLYGVTAVRREKRLDIIIRLERMTHPSQEERTGLTQNTKDVLGAAVPFYVIPVAAGRDITNVVETAALNFRLRQLGHDAAKELDQKLMDFLSSGRSERRGD